MGLERQNKEAELTRNKAQISKNTLCFWSCRKFLTIKFQLKNTR